MSTSGESAPTSMTTSPPIKSGQGSDLSFIHRPLSRYVHEMGRYGLLIDDMVEPAPPPSIIQETGGYPNAGSIPRLLLLCARSSW